MIVRESPKAGASRSQPNWPPKSPHEALISSPSGRKKLEARRRDVSPSPVKRNTLQSRNSALLRLQVDDDNDSNDDNDEDDDEDEEMLRLKLEAIEAKLKLKRLQKAKAKSPASPARDDRAGSSSSRARISRSLQAPTPSSSIPTRSTPELQVPISPVKSRTPPLQTSPARVILGIDKGLRAQDVSLKRSPSHRSKYSALSSRMSASRNSSRQAGRASAASLEPPKSFSERIAESKAQEKQKKEQESRIRQARSSGFGIKAQDLAGTRQMTLPLSPKKNPTTLAKARAARELGAEERSSSNLSNAPYFPVPSQTASAPLPPAGEADETTFDSYSGLHLTKRHLPHNVLTRTLSDKEIYTMPRLLKTVHAPDYDPPDNEGDYVVFGIIASKSLPRAHKETHKVSSNADADESQRSKFMVIRLTDLRWELDLFLFDTGFEAFWKLTPGTVIAILNPGIMPPRVRDSGAFSLKLSSSEDTVLEIGTARDLGFCQSTKKDGNKCTQWIDARKTQFCEFHLAIQLEKTKSGRMEVNTMTGFNRTKDAGWVRSGGGGGWKKGINSHDVTSREKINEKKNGRQYDSTLQESFYVVQGSGSAAKLLDADTNAFDRGMSRAELHRKRLAEKEKERELGSKLAMIGGGGMGSEYLRLRQPESERTGHQDSESLPPKDAASLDLLGRKASDVSLGAANKRKRPATSSSTGSQPMGWGGAYTKGLLDKPKPADLEKHQQKKTRLFLDGKGIRTPGRESLPNLQPTVDDDDDDELDIILGP